MPSPASTANAADIRARAAEGLTALAGDLGDGAPGAGVEVAAAAVKRHKLDLILSGEHPKFGSMPMDRISRSLAGTNINPQQFAATVLQVVTTSKGLTIPEDEALAEATYRSVLVAALNAATIGLSPAPGAGQVWFVPFNTVHPADDKAFKAKKISKGQRRWFPAIQLIVGYQGYVTLAYRSGVLRDLNVGFIWPGQPFETDGVNQLKIGMLPPGWTSEGLKPDYVWFKFRTVAGGEVVNITTYSELLRARESSPTWKAEYAQSGRDWYPDIPWIKWEEPMVLKTAVRRNRRLLPLGDATNPALAGFIAALHLDGTAAIGDRLALPEAWEEPEWVEGGGGTLQISGPDPVEVHGSVSAASKAAAETLPGDALLSGIRAEVSAAGGVAHLGGQRDMAVDEVLQTWGVSLDRWRAVAEGSGPVEEDHGLLVALYQSVKS